MKVKMLLALISVSLFCGCVSFTKIAGETVKYKTSEVYEFGRRVAVTDDGEYALVLTRWKDENILEVVRVSGGVWCGGVSFAVEQSSSGGCCSVVINGIPGLKRKGYDVSRIERLLQASDRLIGKQERGKFGFRFVSFPGADGDETSDTFDGCSPRIHLYQRGAYTPIRVYFGRTCLQFTTEGLIHIQDVDSSNHEFLEQDKELQKSFLGLNGEESGSLLPSIETRGGGGFSDDEKESDRKALGSRLDVKSSKGKEELNGREKSRVREKGIKRECLRETGTAKKVDCGVEQKLENLKKEAVSLLGLEGATLPEKVENKNFVNVAKDRIAEDFSADGGLKMRGALRNEGLSGKEGHAVDEESQISALTVPSLRESSAGCSLGRSHVSFPEKNDDIDVCLSRGGDTESTGGDLSYRRGCSESSSAQYPCGAIASSFAPGVAESVPVGSEVFFAGCERGKLLNVRPIEKRVKWVLVGAQKTFVRDDEVSKGDENVKLGSVLPDGGLDTNFKGMTFLEKTPGRVVFKRLYFSYISIEGLVPPDRVEAFRGPIVGNK